MGMPEKFYKPWEEIDPELKHGGIPGMLAGEYVGPDLTDNTKTRNRDMKYIFEVIRDCAASLSMRPCADAEGPPDYNTMEEVLKALNWFFERVLDRTIVLSSSSFEFTHAVPPTEYFMLRPIHYPLRNQFMDAVIFYMLGTMVEIAEANRNCNHSNLDPSTAVRVLAPCAHLKKNILKDFFDLEVRGEVTVEELEKMFKGIQQPGPVIVPAGESAIRPGMGESEGAREGINLFQWYPQANDWDVFGKKNTEMYKPERIWQPEGEITATEDIAPEQPTSAGGSVIPG